jgi:hypothetical protein
LLSKTALISRLLRREGVAFPPRNDGKNSILNHNKRMKALQNNIPRRGLSLAPCGRGQGEGYAFIEQIFHAFVAHS